MEVHIRQCWCFILGSMEVPGNYGKKIIQEGRKPTLVGTKITKYSLLLTRSVVVTGQLHAAAALAPDKEPQTH